LKQCANIAVECLYAVRIHIAIFVNPRSKLQFLNFSVILSNKEINNTSGEVRVLLLELLCFEVSEAFVSSFVCLKRVGTDTG
jgi:hypothetical protein